MGSKKGELTWIEQYAKERAARDPEFKTELESERVVLALVRARTAASLTQKDVANALKVSQPYIAQIERGSKPMSVAMMSRYADAIGYDITLSPRKKVKSAVSRKRLG